VPAGATYTPISVTNLTTGLTAYSPAPFIVTFPGGGSITSSSFAGRINIGTGNYPIRIAIADLNGDGKPDIVVTNRGSNSLSIFTNTSTSGVISLAGKIDSATGTNPIGLAIGDIDGDGKPDVVEVNNGGDTVSIFRNTSTGGVISFAPKVEYKTGGAPVDAAISDFDGDGKPDIAVTNSYTNTISAFRNTSTPGNISFASKIDAMTGLQPWSIAITDIDGDGKPDAVVTNNAGSTITALRNTSASGSISFSINLEYTAGNGPVGVATADINEDGKLDIAVANSTSNSVSIYRNMSTSGGVSFAEKVDYTTGTGPSILAIADIDGDGKPDIVMTNYSTDNALSVLRNKSVGGSISFAEKTDFITGMGPLGLAIADIDGDGKPDLVTTDYDGNTITIFRNVISPTGVANFESNVPEHFNLMQNYPNPFNPTTNIGFALPKRSAVKLVIYNILSQKVAELVNQEQEAGWHTVQWDANVTSGIYFYQLEAVPRSDPSKRFVETKRMMLLK
jgi:hypothetical protein